MKERLIIISSNTGATLDLLDKKGIDTRRLPGRGHIAVYSVDEGRNAGARVMLKAQGLDPHQWMWARHHGDRVDPMDFEDYEHMTQRFGPVQDLTKALWFIGNIVECPKCQQAIAECKGHDDARA